MAGKKKVEFKFRAPEGTKRICLAGDFNNWNLESHVLKRMGQEWKISIQLPAGEYEYKFLVDGVWYNDSNAVHQVSNVWGSENSVILVK